MVEVDLQNVQRERNDQENEEVASLMTENYNK